MVPRIQAHSSLMGSGGAGSAASAPASPAWITRNVKYMRLRGTKT